MPIEMHPVATRRIFRLAFVTAFALFVSQAVGWSVSFITPVLLSILLALPLPGLKLRQGLIFFLALVIPVWLTTWILLPVLSYQPMVGLLLLIAGCFLCFYYGASGGSPILGAFLTMGLAIVAAVGSDSIAAVMAVNLALTLNAVIAIGILWLAFVLIPEKPSEEGPKPKPETGRPSRQQAIRSAWRSTAIVLPVIVFFLFYAGSASYLAVMIKVASMGQQAENEKTKAVGKSLLLSTLIGGVGALILWNLMSIWPSLLNLTLLVTVSGLLMGRKIFQGQGMTATADTWSYAFLTMLVIIVPSLLDGAFGDAAGAKFFDRIVMMGWATLYGVAAIYVFDAFWRGKSAQPGAD